MKSNALKVNDKDNVAIVVQLIRENSPVIVNGERLFNAAADIKRIWGIGFAGVAAGENVVRYGEPIARPTCDIGQGEWVHVHNTQPVPGDLKE